MPATSSALLASFSSKLSYLSYLCKRLLPKRKRSPADDLPTTRTSPVFCRERGRKVTQKESDGLHAHALGNLEPAVAPAADTTAAINNSDDEVWSWYDSDERNFNLGMVRQLPDTDVSAREDWREDWEPVRMRLREGARRKAVVRMIHDEYCDYDIEAVLNALKEPQEEPEENRGESLDRVVMRDVVGLGSRARFVRRVRKPLRQIALGDSDDEEYELEEVAKRTRDPRSMRTRDGEVACGDAWWKGL